MTRGIPRRKYFREMIKKTGGLGIAIENNCAIEFIGGCFYRVIGSKNYSRAYKVYKSGSDVISEQIGREKHFAPIGLLSRGNLLRARPTKTQRSVSLPPT